MSVQYISPSAKLAKRLRRLPLATIGLIGGLVMGLSGPVAAQDTLDKLPDQPASKEVEKVSFQEVRKILRQLDGEKLEERDEAEKRLIEIGPSVIPFLPEVNANTSGELKIRLQRIRAQLQTTNIETFFEASLVTLSGKMKATEAVEEIAKQTGNVIKIENPEAVPVGEVELKADKQPFWEVLDDVMIQANLRINAYSSGEGLVLVPDNTVVPGPEPAFSGPFHISVVSTQTSARFGGAADGQLDVSLQVAWEPRIKPVYIELPMGKMKVEVAEGAELSSTSPEANPEIPVNSEGSATQIDLQFQKPARTERVIKKLTGEFVAAVPSEKHKYIFEKFGNGKRQSETFGEVTVTLENARKNGSVYEMRILAEFKAAQGALDSFRGWVLSNRAYLLDAKQRRLENVGFQSYSVSSDAVGVAFLFQINGDANDYTLIYESPGMITRQAVKFEISDIDLP